jgi:hypothetical protein
MTAPAGTPGALRTSWLRIRRVVPRGPRNAAMPSWLRGTGVPSDIGSPILENVT